MKDRGYQYSGSSINSSIMGQGYSTIAWLPELETLMKLDIAIETRKNYLIGNSNF